MKCYNCGREVKNNLSFCTNCGTDLRVKYEQEIINNQEEEGKDVSNDNTAMIAIILTVIIAIVVIIMGISGVNSYKDNIIYDNDYDIVDYDE